MATKKVAFQGERGAFSEAAAKKLVGRSMTPVACDSFETLFDAVEKRRADLGIVPIENSLIGSIHRNYDLLLERKLTVIDETQLRVVHCLIAAPGTSIKKITKAYSHPAALDQCRKFFRTNTNIVPVSYYDTAGAVKMLAESDLIDSAAIASPFAADYYKMKQFRKSIEDEKLNFTRFLLLGRKAVNVKGKAKTSVVFSLKSEPGMLFKALSVFALRDINLTKIESRPTRKQVWRYYFYVDFEGHISEEHVQYALDHLGEITHFIKVLGSYPLRVNGG
jgi:prephenate dehydratase